MKPNLSHRLLLLVLTFGTFLGTELAAAPKKAAGSEGRDRSKPVGAKVEILKVPKDAGSELRAAAEKSPKDKSTQTLELTKSSSAAAVAKVPSSYTMDGRKQDKAYDLVSMPLGTAPSSDKLNSSGAGK